MDMLPPVYLGVIIAGSFVLAYVFRAPLERRFVLSRPGPEQPRRQFIVDFSICLLAGLLGSLHNIIFLQSPPTSTNALMIGMAVFGFFLGLDMALARERLVINTASVNNAGPAQWRTLRPMTRTLLWVAAVTIICTIIVLGLVLAKNTSYLSTLGSDRAELLAAGKGVILEMVFVMTVLLLLVTNIILSFSRNLNLLFKKQTEALERVRQGDLSEKVPVVGANEFGLIAAYTNLMIDGLKHRITLLGALKVAEEVQRNLLPEAPPDVPGLEIAGVSLYSEETGGDYYDFIRLPGDRIIAVVGDVSGHGVASALLMASARAFLRMASDQWLELEDVVSQVNSRLSTDVRETGNFLTLFMLQINTREKRLSWVRAGHDPALLFDPQSGEFTELGGLGPALGLDKDAGFQTNGRIGWTPGSILVIGTDGIWETRTPDGEMYGKQRMRDLIKAYHDLSPREILAIVLDSVKRFRQDATQEDDVTLVIIKLD